MQELSPSSPTNSSNELPHLPRSGKPKLRILLYTDDPELVVGPTHGPFGLELMSEHLRGHEPAFADLSIMLESRYPLGSSSADNRINTVLKKADDSEKPFDQVWFFGFHQINKEPFTLGIGGGGRDSELDGDEVKDLRRRMDAGLGVLVTGDHANQRPIEVLPPPSNLDCEDPSRDKRFLGLGRALGRGIPRAGLLRDWEGKPTANPRHSFNTQVVNFGTNVDNEIGFQRDPLPQQLILRTFDETGQPALDGKPHPLFFYRDGHAIQLFPDHLHEGAVVIPKHLDEKDWSKRKTDGFQPRPRVVAFGLDKRNGRKLKLVAAYDGDHVGAGRIVADSSWHHYFNVNLQDFRHPGEAFTATDQIGQFYGNLAVWLAPIEKRYEMAAAMMQWLTTNPEIAEEVSSLPGNRLREIIAVGSTIRRMLSIVASSCEIHELLQVLIDESYRKCYETLYLPERGFTLSTLPSKELILGCLVNEVRQDLNQAVALSLSTADRSAARRKAVNVSCNLAFETQKLKLEEISAAAQSYFSEVQNELTKRELIKEPSNPLNQPNN